MRHRTLDCARSLVLCCLGWNCALEARASAHEPWHTGFLFDQFSLTLDAGTRTEAVGPLYYDQERESEHLFAVPPLFSHTTDEATDAEEFDLL